VVSYELELFHRYRYSLVKRALSPSLGSSRWFTRLLYRRVPLSPSLFSLFFSLPPSIFLSLSACLSDLSPQHANLTRAEFARANLRCSANCGNGPSDTMGDGCRVAAGFVKLLDLEFRGRVAELGEFD